MAEVPMDPTPEDEAKEEAGDRPGGWLGDGVHFVSQKTVTIAWALFLAIVVAAATVLIVEHVRPATPLGLLGEYRSPYVITTIRPGAVGPAATAVGMIQLKGYRCVNRDTIVELYVSYVRIDESTSPVRDAFYGEKVPRQAGCFVQDTILALPAEVVPGHWYVSAVEFAPESGESRRWSSEPFTVVAR